ncbi:MAG: DUF3127 domain-containing protein [Chitinophagales bacterium]|nr:DUF3127 domain-containing protein [Chitinophagales bacterium]MCZ2394805.1 DUF3127 domain-containing protein [Chitinophagales bacterium]
MEIVGVLTKKLPVESGTSANGTWQKQLFVIETEEQYPKKICFSAWNRRVEELTNFSEGNKLKVSFDISSREYNERWYTDVSAWRIEAASNAGTSQGQYSTPAPATAPSYSAPASPAPDNEQHADDDLPF